MLKLTAEQFAQRVAELRLIDRNDLRALQSQYDLRTLSCDDFIELLLRGEYLTNYQVDRLRRGDKSGFFYGRYKVLYLISQGSFARVYRAVEIDTGKSVALKVLRNRHAEVKDIRDRFRREGELGRTLVHPNIVAIDEVYCKGATQFLVMEFVEGQNLREFLKLRKKLTAEEATRLVKDICNGLYYAFNRGLAHRDLKLTNVLVNIHMQAKLIDFGLAGADGELGHDEVQVTDDNIRTVDYAALEKVTNVKRGDLRSDIYFTGAMYYYLLTGVPALSETPDKMKRMVKSRFTEMKPVQALEPTLPWVVTRIVNKAMELVPAARYQTPGEMLIDLATALKALESGTATATAEPVPETRAAPASARQQERFSAQRQPTLVIVEADPRLQDVFREQFKKHGYRVLMITDLRRALIRATDEMEPADGLVLDATAAGASALEAFNALSRLPGKRPMPALLILNEDQADWKNRALIDDHRDVLVMPLKMKEMLGRIKRLVPLEPKEAAPPVATVATPPPASAAAASPPLPGPQVTRAGALDDSDSKDSIFDEPGHDDGIFEGRESIDDNDNDKPGKNAADTAVPDATKASKSKRRKGAADALDDPSSASIEKTAGGKGSTSVTKSQHNLFDQDSGGYSLKSEDDHVAGQHKADGGENLGVVDNYELIEELGQGGMGTVYRARHKRMHRMVAIKILAPERVGNRRAVQRFHREIKAVAKLDHNNIVIAHDAGESEGRHYLVMEYIKGIDLSDLVKYCGPLPVPDTCELIRQAAIGLQHAFEHGMVHRDIKPSNLLLEIRSAELKILDLGLALLQGDGDGEELTGFGQVLGTVEYMAPEQWSDTHNVDTRADVYSLGCTMYRLLTGQPPFSGSQYPNLLKKMMAHAQTPVPPIRQRRPDVPEELSAIIEKMLAKTPQERYSQPWDIATALTPYAVGFDLFKLIRRAQEARTLPQKDPNSKDSKDSKAATKESLPRPE